MKGNLGKRLASWNRYLALAGGVLLLAGLAAILIRGGGRFLIGEIGMAAGLLLLLAAWIVNPAAVRQVLGGRAARYGTSVALMALALVGIMVLFNVLSYRHYKRWDLTEERLHTLSSQTREVLAHVNRPVQITGFFYKQQSDQESEARYMLENYKAASPFISYRIADPEVSRVLAQRYNVSGDSYILVFESGDKRYNIVSLDEADLTGAILKVTSDREVTVYFVTGHGEGDIYSTDRGGFAAVRDMLEKAYYRVETLQLSTYTGTLPATDTVVVLLGPRQPLEKKEEQALAAYLARGGKLLALLDPAPSIDLNKVLRFWGVYVDDVLVVDPAEAMAGGDAATPTAAGKNQEHPITKTLRRTFFPGARSVELATTALPGVKAVPLLVSSQESWGESDVDHQPVGLDSQDDVPGPVYLAACVQGQVSGSKQSAETRIVVVGDSDFAANWAAQGGNQELFFNAVNWLAELIEVVPVQFVSRQVVLNALQARAIRYTTLVGLPLVIVAAGVGVWLQRRKR